MIDWPGTYIPSAGCSACREDFSSVTNFDRHRTGRHAYTFAEGLRMDPPREDGRRCLDHDELLALGLRPMSDDEMRAGPHRGRAGMGVRLWFDPAAVEEARRAFGREEQPA